MGQGQGHRSKEACLCVLSGLKFSNALIWNIDFRYAGTSLEYLGKLIYQDHGHMSNKVCLCILLCRS